jgi:serine/threonine-protein kinase
MRLSSRCAVKESVPDSAASPQALAQLRQQFQLEARTLASLSHPNLPKVTDYFSEAGNEYLVMEYVEGEDLASVLARHGGPLPEKPVLIWADQTLAALEYLHTRQPNPIIHRDIKPGNIILTPVGQVKLVDFGLVKLFDPANPRTATAMKGLGTPEYTPLEQYAGGAGHTDARSDIYALGATLYHLLTATPPANAPQRSLNPASLAAPRRLNPALTPTTEAALLKALEIHPDQRFQSAKEMRQTLAGARTGITPPTPPRLPPTRPPAPSRWSDWRLWAGLAGLLLLILAFLAFRPGGFLAPAPTTTLTPPVARVPATATPSPTRTPPRPTEAPKPVALTDTPVPTQTRRAATATPTPMSKPAATLTPLPAGPASAADLTATAVFGTLEALTRLPSRTPVPTPTVTPTATVILTPDATRTAAVAKVNAVATATAVGVTVPYDVYFNPTDLALYVRVPAGAFRMGSSDSDADAESDEKPQHTVYLDEFWIMQTEATKDQYQRCVAAGQCAAPSCSGTGQGNHPVVCVSWQDAANYCAWAGGRLPTEAEWEKAARGADGRKYPWGNQTPSCTLANYFGCQGRTNAAGSYPAGASPYGVLDMAGNVWEWVADWYGERYYANSSGENPTGPASGQGRVLRGGSWVNEQRFVRAAYRVWSDPGSRNDNLGFRCARSS